uniref:Uncharacterized protein n=1 Tax=Picea glauca TaxID=3330 RepID=A0A117NJF2_PICGL|nr:hypothetical protein ABT39_MTgene1212 [Picea glauca]
MDLRLIDSLRAEVRRVRCSYTEIRTVARKLEPDILAVFGSKARDFICLIDINYRMNKSAICQSRELPIKSIG